MNTLYEDLALTIDLGTGGPKVAFVTLTGRLVWHTLRAVPTTMVGDGGFEQDARLWWDLIRDAVREGLADPLVRADAVVAIAVTGQWDSTVPVDAEGHPVGPCILWLDRRGADLVNARLGGPVAGYHPLRLAEWIRKTGGVPGEKDVIAHVLHLEERRPDIANRTRWYLEPVDYITMRFTGVATASHASMTAAWLTDNRDPTLLEYDAGLAARAGVPLEKLPPLRPTASIIGTVRDDVAADLGLPRGVEVVTGMTDLHAAALGSGAVNDFEAHLALSTSAWISAPVPFKKTDVLRQITSVPGLWPGQYLVADNHDTGGACLEWLRDKVFAAADAEPPGFSTFLEAAELAPPGSNGVVFTPWLKGSRTPVLDPFARGGFHNIGLATGRSDLVRALLEGVAYNNRWLHEAVERFAGRRLDHIRMLGGGANSLLWCQIHADVLGRTIERVAEPHFAQARGMALAAGLARGMLRPHEVRELVEVDAVLEPDPAVQATYARLYAEFPRLYRAQKSMFRRLNSAST
ncbi:FGGY-family carbohydrate kinase [Intrasporangium calvum]|uniref:FGGY-family carbohydrate kinase n=1 Tax=Intrasporangium calvum TaxID=53358 RepID=A0ABT5GG01_9MICO|nr:FGGY-family carbohydrate kinase [Intrasporangium calvum]MDC5697190.1 FGGY-family carbohydrate kinase [Intrasporangium calvum]